MLPIKDLNRTSITPHINRMLLIVNVLIFALYFLSTLNTFVDPRLANFIDNQFILVPYQILHGQKLYTLVTSMFMHASWLHLLGNMLYLYIFGDNVEGIFNHGGYLAFYLFSGIVAAFTFTLTLTGTDQLSVGLLGASGAIAGVLGAYLVLFPRAQILTLAVYILIPVPAIAVLGFWFVLQWIFVLFDAAGEIAYFAHIGGFVFGMLVAGTVGLRKKKNLLKRSQT